MVKKEVGGSIIERCSVCGNEYLYKKGEFSGCPYCSEYYKKVLEKDLDKFMKFIFIRDGIPVLLGRRGALDNFGNFAGKDISRCVNCGKFQYSTNSSMCNNCGAGAAVGDRYSLTDRYMCKECLHVLTYQDEKCQGCLDILSDRRKITKFMNSFEGRVYNNLQVLRQYRTPAGILCDAKCLWRECGKIYTGISLYDLVSVKVYCTRTDEFMSVYCDGCGTVERLSNVEVYSRQHKCKKCGIEIGLNLRLYANDADKYTKLKVKYLSEVYGYDKEIKNGALIKNTGIFDLYKVAPIWNTRHLIMAGHEVENMLFRLGGRVGDGFFSTDVIWDCEDFI